MGRYSLPEAVTIKCGSVSSVSESESISCSTVLASIQGSTFYNDVNGVSVRRVARMNLRAHIRIARDDGLDG